MKTGRNDFCPCGSGLKYKKCCLKNELSDTKDQKALYYRKFGIRIKTAKDIAGIRLAGKLAVETLELVREYIRPGVKTDDINTFVHEFTIKNGAIPAPLNYRGYPKSVCISINEVICHGIPGKRMLADGDIVNIDVTPILGGYYADANMTYLVGNCSSDAKKIVNVARESLKAGMSMIMPGNTIGDIGWAIQQYAEGQGCSVVRDFVGHGVGIDFHEAPQIPHYGRKGQGIRLVPGMVFTVEPMINLGKKELHILSDKWTAVTDDNSLSAQFEQTFLVTEQGYESLTPFDLDTPL
ncbi:MAG: type I methionyl aminopeptidase [Deltaproteobacteria bacterium]|nr:type I methionyl aminopeptidase [Deltaproteobacteria bacterium]